MITTVRSIVAPLVVLLFALLLVSSNQVVGAATVDLADKVVIRTTTDGKTHTFLKSEAIDKGSFTSPAGFTQRNLCDTSTLAHMTVCFRPDNDASRDEVVFEYGTFMQQPVTTGAYVAEFWKGSTKLGEQAVTNHYFYQRWRWIPQGYRARYRTIAAVEADKLLPPHRKGIDPDVAKDTIEPAPSNCAYAKPFDTACVTMYMGGTGERSDIGPVTGTQGNYLLSGRDDWWRLVLDQAEAGSGIPWYIRDEGGTPVNFFRTGTGIVDRVKLNSHGNNAGSPTYLPRPGHDYGTEVGMKWSIDQAHQPALFYVPWILTGDPYYLESMQFANSNNTLYTGWDRRITNQADLMEDQIRGIAWNLRTMFQLWKTTPNSVPGWLLPQSYYERQATENLTKMKYKFMDDTTEPYEQYLNAMGRGFWQNDFMTYIVGWGVYMGNSTWQPAFDWLYEHTSARLTGTSGWERRCPTNYYLPEDAASLSQYTSWAKAWQIEKTANNRVVPTDTNLLCEVSAYSSYLLGAEAIASHLGKPGAETRHAWYTTMMKNTLKSPIGGYTMGGKWAIAAKYQMNGTTPPPDIIDDGSVTPVPTPTATLIAVPNSVSSGQSTTLTWSSSNATTCTGTNFNTSGKTAGTVTVTLTSSATFTVTCGSAVAQASVSVASAPVATNFAIYDRIRMTTNTNLRETANGVILGTQSSNSQGTVVAAPVTAGGYVWIKVDFDSGLDGWVAAMYAVKTGVFTPPTDTPPPLPPSTPATTSDTWVKIANENQGFMVLGTQVVRYGKGTTWTQKTVTDTGRCTNSFFGKDPLRGTVKECQVKASGVLEVPLPDSNAEKWTKVADENQDFTVTGTQKVRYGNGTVWVTKNVTNSGKCTNTFFGRDPLYGIVKECQVSASAVTLPKEVAPTTTTPVTTPTATAETWTKIASEYQNFTIEGTQIVRYGKETTWIEKTVTNSGQCTNTFFGRDPLVGVVKECQVKGASASAPNPTSDATPTPNSSVFAAGSDTLIGTSGDDTLTATAGIKKVDGLGGTDTLKLTQPNNDANSAWFVVTTNSDGTKTITDTHASGYAVTVYGIEKVIPPSNYGEISLVSKTSQVKAAPLTGAMTARFLTVPFTVRMTKGAMGDSVSRLQVLLAHLGYFKETPSGYYGPLTAAAVAAFQADNGLSPVGEVGTRTLEALNVR